MGLRLEYIEIYQNTWLSSKNWRGKIEGWNAFKSNVAIISCFIIISNQLSNILSLYITASETFCLKFYFCCFLVWYAETMVPLRYKWKYSPLLINREGSKDKERLLDLTGIKANKAQVPKDVFSGEVWDNRALGLT